jgi:hypothetical protein
LRFVANDLQIPIVEPLFFGKGDCACSRWVPQFRLGNCWSRLPTLFALRRQSKKVLNAMQDLTEYTRHERPETLLDVRSLGSVQMLDLTQAPGSFPDPACDFYYLQSIRSRVSGRSDIAYGGYKYSVSGCSVGDMCVSPSATSCDYELSVAVQLMMLSLPGALVRSVGAELNPHFSGDLSVLHRGMFRSSQVMQRMLNMWRCASNVEIAPAMDAQAQAIELAETLIRLAMNSRAIRAQRAHLRWHVRCQVLQYVDAHRGEDMPLAKLANIA